MNAFGHNGEWPVQNVHMSVNRKLGTKKYTRRWKNFSETALAPDILPEKYLGSHHIYAEKSSIPIFFFVSEPFSNPSSL